MTKTLTIKGVEGAVFHALECLDPAIYSFERQEFGDVIRYTVRKQGEFLGFYRIGPGQDDGTVGFGPFQESPKPELQKEWYFIWAKLIHGEIVRQFGEGAWLKQPTPTSGAALGNGSKSLSESGSPTLADLMRRMEEMYHDLGSKLDDLKRGMAIIYRHINAKDQTTITMILEDVRQGRIEQGEIQNELDAIRKVLRHIHTTTLPIADTAIKKSLDDIYQAVNSNLSFHQQLELSLPVIPFLLEYKIGLDAGVDLGAVWKELGERLGKGSG